MSEYKKLPQINFRADQQLRDAFDEWLRAQRVDRTAFFTQVMRDAVEHARNTAASQQTSGKSADSKLRKKHVAPPEEVIDLFAMLTSITTSSNEIAKSGVRAAIVCAATMVSNGRYRDIKNLLSQARASAQDAKSSESHGAFNEGDEGNLRTGRGAA